MEIEDRFDMTGGQSKKGQVNYVQSAMTDRLETRIRVMRVSTLVCSRFFVVRLRIVST